MPRLALLIVPLLSLALAAQASARDELAQRVSFRAMQKQDPELLQAVSVIVAKGFLAEIAEEVGAARPAPPAGEHAARAKEIQKIAMAYVKKNVQMAVGNRRYYGTTQKKPKKISVTQMVWKPGDVVAKLEFRFYYSPGFLDNGYDKETETYRIVTVDVRLGQVTDVKKARFE
jgi:hypothetical protein